MHREVEMKLSQNDIDRFWIKVDKRGPDDCWPWLASKSKFGYGVFSVKHKWIAAHRVSFLISNGYLPNIKQRRLVMHDCENPSCQNPNHLLDGTTKENGNYPGCVAKLAARVGPLASMWGRSGRIGLKHSAETKAKMSQKAIARGGWHKGLRRSNTTKLNISIAARGENNGNSRLTERIVQEIRKSKFRNIDLAKKYQVDPSIVSSIRRRTRWKHIP